MLILNPDLMDLSLDDEKLTKIFNQKLDDEVKKYLKEEKRLNDKSTH